MLPLHSSKNQLAKERSNWTGRDLQADPRLSPRKDSLYKSGRELQAEP
jgi:hypothetical protein